MTPDTSSKLVYLGYGKERLTVRVRSSSKVSYISIKFTKNRNIELIVPPDREMAQAILFLKSRENQIRAKLQNAAIRPKSTK